jgi:uracil-DNA glycosylase
MDEPREITGEQLRLALLQRLESLHRSGVRQLARPPAGQRRTTPAGPRLAGEAGGTPRAPRPARQPAQARPAESTATGRSAGTVPVSAQAASAGAIAPPPDSAPRPAAPAPNAAPRSTDERVAALGTLQNEVVQCVRCAELAASRSQTVFGVGNPRPRLCFLGEAPGADEDRQGEPFVGAAGQLLNKIIQACGLSRQEVYILNVLKCRPPRNRSPLPEEVANCRSHFERQLEILQPEFICCLGAVAAHALLRSTQSVGQLRGRFHDYRGATVLVTYHPSYLLRAPEMKREAWEDMQRLMRKMGQEIPGNQG